MPMLHAAIARARALLGLLALACVPGQAQTLPSVASINLCADQLVLSLALPAQILSLSWLASDPEESMLADEARAFPVNYGSAEELLRLDPDVVVAGAYTNAFTRRLVAELGYRVVTLEPETSLDDIERNIEIVAAAIERPARGRELIAKLRADAATIAAAQPGVETATVVVRPGGFTVGAGSLADRLMRLGGLRNVAAERGLDRWGSLSIETLLRTDPELLIFTGYRHDQPSMHNVYLAHPALAALDRELPTVVVPAKFWSCGLPQSLESLRLIRRTLAADRK
jgi:iron complex transport system substrate-binding protein